LEIARTGNFFVHILDPRPAVVASAQEAVDVEGLYGKRIVAERSPFQPLPYADNLLDLVLIPQVTNGSLNNYSLSEIMRVLRPGGVVFFGNSNPRGSLSLKELNAFCLHVPYGEQLVIGDASGLWMMLRKSPPEGIDEWPMWEHGPDNNPVSSDEVIRAPYMTQWLGNPFYKHHAHDHHGVGRALVSGDGPYRPSRARRNPGSIHCLPGTGITEPSCGR
jgi:SAM-dependent methyltransferase